MAGFGPNDIKKASGNEEAQLKQVIVDAWTTMKRTNWDDTRFCTVTPTFIITYSIAKNFKMFFESEGWKVQIKKAHRNYYFDVYSNYEDMHS